MGLPFELKPLRGPVPDRPIRTVADLERLNPDPNPDSYRHIIDLLHRVKKELNGELPVLAFAGAPFTVAAYCIGTGKHMDQTRLFAKEQPKVWRALLERLSHATVGFLNTLIREGAQLYQLFDSWAGELTLAEYDAWAQPYHREIIAGASAVPRVMFVKECPYLDRLVATGADIISLGRRHDLAAARRDHPNLVFQGNVDEEILAHGTPEQVVAATRKCLQDGGGRRHIVNLNHGCDKSTPVENFEAYVRTVREYRS
jgi:uroporphyrinogen decarboxylase